MPTGGMTAPGAVLLPDPGCSCLTRASCPTHSPGSSFIGSVTTISITSVCHLNGTGAPPGPGAPRTLLVAGTPRTWGLAPVCLLLSPRQPDHEARFPVVSTVGQGDLKPIWKATWPVQPPQPCARGWGSGHILRFTVCGHCCSRPGGQREPRAQGLAPPLLTSLPPAFPPGHSLARPSSCWCSQCSRSSHSLSALLLTLPPTASCFQGNQDPAPIMQVGETGKGLLTLPRVSCTTGEVNWPGLEELTAPEARLAHWTEPRCWGGDQRVGLLAVGARPALGGSGGG